LYHWDWVSAERDFLAALQAGASQSTARQWYAMHFLVPHRRFSEALESLAHARQLDPLSPVLEASVGIVHYYAGDFDSALETFERLILSHPDLGLAHYFLGQVLTATGRHADAVAILQAAAERWPAQVEIVAGLGVAHAAADNLSAARMQLDALTRAADGHYVSPVLIAYLHSAIGDHAAAMQALGRAVDQRATELVLLPVRRELDALRSLPRYQSILDTIRLSF
jgi:tetratricopeptide (TPR) repeat protein